MQLKQYKSHFVDHIEEIKQLDGDIIELKKELNALKAEKSRIFAALKGKS